MIKGDHYDGDTPWMLIPLCVAVCLAPALLPAADFVVNPAKVELKERTLERNWWSLNRILKGQ